MLGRAYRYTRRNFQKWRMTRELARESRYSFTSDYISKNLDNWTRLLEEYRGRPGIQMLEIGSYEGRSAVWFLENILTHPTAGIVCIDFFTRLSLSMRFDHNIRHSGAAGKVTKIKGHSDAILITQPLDHFDIIYVDGSHDAAPVLMDAMLCWYRLKPGGVMIFDDYLWEKEGPASDHPQIAIDLFLTAFEGSYDLLLKDYQVAIRKHANQTRRQSP
jgi:predicted O-methyltransferase YrrM